LWLVLLAVPLPFISHHMAYWLYCAVYTGYVCLYLAYGHYRRELDISRIGDFSYGVYLYAYPVQQTLLHYSKLSISGWELVWYSGLVTSLFAVASWYLVEQPALRLKPGKRPEAAPAAQSLPAAA
jgi:peptidoglycan/LPS O-acetylase OafA/YrhL